MSNKNNKSWKKRLLVFSKEQSVEFACYCSILVIPFLGVRGNFDFWDKHDRQKQLYSILNMIDLTYSRITAGKTAESFATSVANKAAARAAVIAAASFADEAAARAAVIAATSGADKAATRSAVVAATSGTDKVAAMAAAIAADIAVAANSAATANNLADVIANVTSIASTVTKAAAVAAAVNRADDEFLKQFRSYISKMLISIREGLPLPTFNAGSFYGEIYDNFLIALKDCGCEYWTDVYEHMFANRLKLDEEELLLRLQVPDSVKDKGAAEVAKHMLALKEQGNRGTKEARIILLGAKGAGKTSLAMKLHNAYAFMPRKEKSTDGVIANKLRLIPKETTHLWDFGGHVIIQAAHRCFMSAECLYVLVMDGRTEQQQDIDEYRKWLTTVKTYSGGNARVFIVLNESDAHKRSMPDEQLNEEFPNLIERFYAFNFKRDKKALRILKTDIRNYIETNFQRKLPKQYFSVKQELEQQFKKHKKEVLNEKDIERIITDVKLKGGSQGVLKYLNTLGVALRYDEIPGLILNPSWISHGVYRIINHMQDNGLVRIHLDDISKIFNKKDAVRYDINNQKLLYNLMVKYELAFTVNDAPNTLLVPAVLPEKRPSSVLKPRHDEETLSRRYSFEIALSDSVFPRYIQRNHEHIERQINGDFIVWHGGMSLVWNNTIATVVKENRKIEITVWGENKSEFLHNLHNELLKLLGEHYLQWDRDEVKLSQVYYATDVIRKLYNEGVTELGGNQIEAAVNQYHISLIENFNFKVGINPELSIAGLSLDANIKKRIRKG